MGERVWVVEPACGIESDGGALGRGRRSSSRSRVIASHSEAMAMLWSAARKVLVVLPATPLSDRAISSSTRATQNRPRAKLLMPAMASATALSPASLLP